MRRFAHIALVLLLLVVPAASYAQDASAQTQSDLSASIRNAILSDPRSANLSSAQIDAIVSSLSQKATEQGMTQEDIYRRPTLPQTLDASAASGQFAGGDCGSMLGFICGVNHAFGLSGSNTIPLISVVVTLAGILAGLGLWVELRHRRRARESAASSV